MLRIYEAEVTPDMAREMWEKSNGNPRFTSKGKMVNREKVKALAEVLRNGGWHMSGDTIKFGENGELIDGHHRIAAIIESGVPARLLIVEGVSPDGAKHIDSNNRRAEYARLNTAPFVPAMIRLERAMMSGGIVSRMDYVPSALIEAGINENREYLEFIARVRSRNSMGNKRYMRNSSFDCAILHALKCGVSREEIELITYKVASGDIDFNAEPALFKLREFCITNNLGGHCSPSARISNCCFIQQCIYDHLNGTYKKGSYRSPKAMYTNQLTSR